MFSLLGSPKPSGSGNQEQNSDPPTALLQGATSSESKILRALRLSWGWALRVFGRILTIANAIVGFVGVFVGVFAREFAILPFLLLCILGCIVGLKINLIGNRITQKRGKTVLATDIRDPVVYLRPFNSDLQTTVFAGEASLWRIIAPEPRDVFKRVLLGIPRVVSTFFELIIAPPRTEEEQLESALRRIGPPVAVARPGEMLPPAGIPRLQLSSDSWQREVSALLKRAQLVVLRCGSARNLDDGYWSTYYLEIATGGLAWEISAAVKEVPPEKLVLLSPFDYIDYEDFRSKVNDLFPKGLPPWVESEPEIYTIRGIIWFDKDWNAQYCPITRDDTLWRLGSGRYPLSKALTEKFRTFRGEKRSNFGARTISLRLCAIVVLLLISIAIAYLSKLPLGPSHGLPVNARPVMPVMLPATFVGDYPLADVEVKGRHFKFLVGTQFGNTVIDNKSVVLLNLRKQPRKVKVVSGMGEELADVTERVTLGLGPARLIEPGLVISNLAPMSAVVGTKIDGLIGYSLLKSAVVTINYASRKITMANPNSFNYKGTGTIVPLSIHNGWGSVNATLHIHGLPASHSDYWINTAQKFAIFDPNFPAKNRLAAPGIRNAVSRNAGDPIPIGQFESFQIGDLKLDHLEMPCCAHTTAGNLEIGAGILKNFVVTFDYPHSRLILEPIFPERIAKVPKESAATGLDAAAISAKQKSLAPQSKSVSSAPAVTQSGSIALQNHEKPIATKVNAPVQLIVDPVRQAELERSAQAADKSAIWTGYPNCGVILGTLTVTPTPASLKSVDSVQCGESLDVLVKENKFYLVRTKRNILGYVVANAVSPNP